MAVHTRLHASMHGTRQLFASLRAQRARVAAWALFHVCLIGFFWGYLGVREVELQARAVRQLQSSAVALSESYAEQLSRVLHAAEERCGSIALQWERWHTAVELSAAQRPGDLLDHADLLLTDAQGEVRAAQRGAEKDTRHDAALAPALLSALANRYRTGELKGFQVLPPAPGDARERIGFVRDLHGADGRFDGIVLIRVARAYFSSDYRRMQSSPLDLISIRSPDGATYFRESRGADQAPASVSDTLALPGPSGVIRPQGDLFSDGLERLVAWRPVADYPLVSVAALALEDIRVPLEREAAFHRRLAWTGTGISLAIFLAGLYALTMLHQRRRAEDRIRRIYRLATEAAGEGFYMIEALRDAAGTVVDFIVRDCNEGGARFMGRRSEEVIGKKFSDFYSGPHGERVFRLFCDALASGYYEDEFEVSPDSPMQARWMHRRLVGADGGLAMSVRDISHTKAHESALSQAANTDALTSLPNRHWFMRHLPQTLAHARTTGSTVALLFVDLDRFKEINDQLGHAVGDSALRIAAERLRHVVRPQDKVSRIGGDEFTVVLESVHRREEVAGVAARIVQSLRAPLRLDGVELPSLGASVGIALFPHDGADAVALLRHADMAMYAAKSDGKGRFSWFSALDPANGPAATPSPSPEAT